MNNSSCTTEHPEYSSLTCHLVGDHTGNHFSTGYSWVGAEPQGVPVRVFDVRRAELTRAKSRAGLEAGWLVWEDGRIIADGFDTRREARAWVSEWRS